MTTIISRISPMLSWFQANGKYLSCPRTISKHQKWTPGCILSQIDTLHRPLGRKPNFWGGHIGDREQSLKFIESPFIWGNTVCKMYQKNLIGACILDYYFLALLILCYHDYSAVNSDKLHIDYRLETIQNLQEFLIFYQF